MRWKRPSQLLSAKTSMAASLRSTAGRPRPRQCWPQNERLLDARSISGIRSSPGSPCRRERRSPRGTSGISPIWKHGSSIRGQVLLSSRRNESPIMMATFDPRKTLPGLLAHAQSGHDVGQRRGRSACSQQRNSLTICSRRHHFRRSRGTTNINKRTAKKMPMSTSTRIALLKSVAFTMTMAIISEITSPVIVAAFPRCRAPSGCVSCAVVA